MLICLLTQCKNVRPIMTFYSRLCQIEYRVHYVTYIYSLQQCLFLITLIIEEIPTDPIYYFENKEILHYNISSKEAQRGCDNRKNFYGENRELHKSIHVLLFQYFREILKFVWGSTRMVCFNLATNLRICLRKYYHMLNKKLFSLRSDRVIYLT